MDERVTAHIPRLSDDELLATFEEWPYGPYTRELISRYKLTCGMFDAQEELLTKIAKKYPKIWEEFAP